MNIKLLTFSKQKGFIECFPEGIGLGYIISPQKDNTALYMFIHSFNSPFRVKRWQKASSVEEAQGMCQRDFNEFLMRFLEVESGCENTETSDRGQSCSP